MAKKKHKKKHNFKYSAPSSSTTAPSSGPAPTTKSETVVKTPVAVAAGNRSNTAVADDFSYVRRDLTKVGILTASFTVLQFVLWYLFNNSALGPQVYRLIKL